MVEKKADEQNPSPTSIIASREDFQHHVQSSTKHTRPALPSILRNSKENLTEKFEDELDLTTHSLFTTADAQLDHTKQHTRRSVFMPKASSESCLNSLKAHVARCDRFRTTKNPSDIALMTRHISHEEIERKKTIRFDPRIWVHEILSPPGDNMWYNASDMNR